MEVVNHHGGLEVASPQQDYTNTSPQPSYVKEYYPPAGASAPSYFTQPQAPASHTPSHVPPSHAPIESWDKKNKKQRSWLLPAAIAAGLTAIIVGGAVGGGLGATLSSCQANLRSSEASLSILQAYGCTSSPSGSPTAASTPASTSTTTASLDNYVVPAPDKITSISTDCQALSRQNQASWQSAFKVTCGVDLGSGDRTNSAGDSVYVADVAAMVAYSFQTCIDACSSYTKMNAATTGSKCQAVTFRWELAGWYNSNDHANCWLKNSTVSVDGATPNKELLLSANMLS